MSPGKRNHDLVGEDGDGDDSSSSVPGNQTAAKRPKKSKTKTINDLMELMITQNSETKEAIAAIKEQVSKIEENTVNINKSISDLRTEFESKVTDHHHRIDNLEMNLDLVSDKLNYQGKANDSLYIEVNKVNLILSGLQETTNETTEQLIEAVKKLFETSTGRKISIDHAFRFGSAIPKKIKVRFLSLNDRNATLSSGKNLPQDVFINEDLPPSIRKAHGMLRSKSRELRSLHETDVKVDWKNFTVASSTQRFKIINGLLTNMNLQGSSSSSVFKHPSQPSSQTSISGYSSTHQSTSSFLDRRK